MKINQCKIITEPTMYNLEKAINDFIKDKDVKSISCSHLDGYEIKYSACILYMEELIISLD